MINKDKQKKLEDDMKAAGIHEEDIEEQFILGSGSGGQKINKTNSTVFLKHIPTGITVRCGKDRMRANNRFFARRRLLEKYVEQIQEKKSKRMKEIDKIRKQKRRRSRKVKEKMLEDKRSRSSLKKGRAKPKDHD